MKLGNRLGALAAMVPPGSRMADVGTDHAYLPLYLILNGRIERAVATDIHNGPFRSAKDAVARAGLAERIDVRLGDGLAAVSPGEVDVAVLAGMGAPTIIEILTASPQVTASLKNLILQPMVAVPLVRQWLVSHHWRIADEEIVQEDGRLYEIIAAQPGQLEKTEPALLEVGPVLWRRRHPLLKALLQQRLDSARRIVAQLAKGAVGTDNPKYQEQTALIALLEAKLACL